MAWCRAAITLTQSRTHSIAWLCSGGSRVPPTSGTEMFGWGFDYLEAATLYTKELWETSCMSKEQTPRCHNRGLWIRGCGLSLSTAMGSRYMAKHWLRVLVKVEGIVWAWHARLEGYSGWMWSLQETEIEWEDNYFGGAPGTVDCFRGATGTIGHLGGASGKLYVCFRCGLVLGLWYRPGGVWGPIWVRSSHG